MGIDVKLDNPNRNVLWMREMKLFWSRHKLSSIYGTTDHHLKNINYNEFFTLGSRI